MTERKNLFVNKHQEKKGNHYKTYQAAFFESHKSLTTWDLKTATAVTPHQGCGKKQFLFPSGEADKIYIQQPHFV